MRDLTKKLQRVLVELEAELKHEFIAVRAKVIAEEDTQGTLWLAGRTQCIEESKDTPQT